MSIKKQQPGVNDDDLYNEDEEGAEDELSNGDDEPTEDQAGAESDTNDDEDQPRAKGHVKGFNKRINELTKKRREAERERDAERARNAELERKLREVESFQSDAEIQAIEAKLGGMAQRLMAARAADDAAEEVKIQQEIAEESQRKMVHLARKSVNEADRTRQVAQQQVQPAPRRVVAEVEMLVEANPWLVAPSTSEERQAALIARRFASQLEEEGLDPHTDPEYAEQMEILLGEELTKRGINVLQYTYNPQNQSSAAQKGNQSQANPAKAGQAQRGGLSSSSSVKSAKGPSFKLTSAQKEVAKAAGMSEAKYAEYLANVKE